MLQLESELKNYEFRNLIFQVRKITYFTIIITKLTTSIYKVVINYKTFQTNLKSKKVGPSKKLGKSVPSLTMLSDNKVT